MLIGQFAGGVISIHALREEGDASPVLQMMFTWTFLSTPSARRATPQGVCLHRGPGISIHALREEGDFRRGVQLVHIDDISIHALREEGDPTRPRTAKAAYDFYPRPPRGGRPLQVHQRLHPAAISIHALREEGDLSVLDTSVTATVFLSTPSARRATPLHFYANINHTFLSTPSARRATRSLPVRRPSKSISIHALREEGDWMQRWP